MRFRFSEMYNTKNRGHLTKCPLFFRRWRDAYFLSLFYLLSCPLLYFHSLQGVAGAIGEEDVKLAAICHALGRTKSVADYYKN